MDIGFALFALIINNAIGVHRKTLLNKALADQRMRRYSSHKEFYIHKTAEGVETLAAPVYPKHTIGEQHEPNVENPMCGFRGCGRYTEQFFVKGLAIGQGAVRIVQGAMGLKNSKTVILFVHALDTARDLNEVLEKNGSKCGEDGPKDAEGEHDG